MPYAPEPWWHHIAEMLISVVLPLLIVQFSLHRANKKKFSQLIDETDEHPPHSHSELDNGGLPSTVLTRGGVRMKRTRKEPPWAQMFKGQQP